MADLTEKVVKIKVIGVGGAGNNVINRMIASGVQGVEFVAINTDKQDLNKSTCKNKIQIGEKLTGGMGAGSKPEIGQKSAEESKNAIAQVLEDTDMVFITAGMGGGTGTGAAPIIAQLAHDKGILTVGVVTKPFKFEGANRMRQAEGGIANLSDKVDSLIIIPNDRLKFVTDQKITFANAFGIADDVLKQAVSSISELVAYSEHVIINLDFADVSAIMKDAATRTWALARLPAATRQSRPRWLLSRARCSKRPSTARQVFSSTSRALLSSGSTMWRQLRTSSWRLRTPTQTSSSAQRATMISKTRCA